MEWKEDGVKFCDFTFKQVLYYLYTDIHTVRTRRVCTYVHTLISVFSMKQGTVPTYIYPPNS